MFLQFSRFIFSYTMAHIWACPPNEGEDYIFYCHPPEQKIPKPKRLQEWYKRMLDKAVIEHVVFDYKNIYRDGKDNNLTSPAQMPYFEGDYWPTLLEDSIKEFDQKEEEKQNKQLEEADETPDETPESTGAPAAKRKKKGQKSNQKKKQKSKMSSQRKNNKNKCVPYGNDLTAKLFQTMEIHKNVSTGRLNLEDCLFMHEF